MGFSLYKPTILGYLHIWKHPCIFLRMWQDPVHTCIYIHAVKGVKDGQGRQCTVGKPEGDLEGALRQSVEGLLHALRSE